MFLNFPLVCKKNKRIARKRVTIVIEIFYREITSVLLIKSELEKRGYDVSIKRKSDDISFKQSDILIIPNGYNTSSYEHYRYRFNCKSGKIINLQWEQLFSRYEEEHDIWLAEGRAKELVFLCWGQNRVDKLLNVGVKKHRIFKVGPIQTDTMRKELRSIWKSRKEISDEYYLDDSKKWILFVSSLTFAVKDSSFIKSSRKIGNKYMNYDQRHVMEKKTQEDIISWFIRILDESDDYIIIYRPHPNERCAKNLDEAKRKYSSRFYVIDELDLKQWINVSDILILWNSTSAIECSFTNKKCIITQPHRISYEQEYILYDDCDLVDNYDDFIKKIVQKEIPFPIRANLLSYYYDITDQPSYIRICNVIDSVNIDYKYDNFEKGYSLNRLKYLLSRHIYFKCFIKAIYRFLHNKFHFRIKNPSLRNTFFVEDWEKSEQQDIITKMLGKTIRSMLISTN